MDKWREIQNKNGQPMIERWTDELEEQLIAASKTDIAIGDTAVRRYKQRRMEDFKQAAPKLTDKQWAIMNVERESNTRQTRAWEGTHRRVVGGFPDNNCY